MKEISRRQKKVNSQLRDVIAEVIRNKVGNLNLQKELITVSGVETSKDILHAKVYISIYTDDEALKEKTFHALQSARGFIQVQASKQLSMRYFPELLFRIDDSLKRYARIDSILHSISEEQKERESQIEEIDDNNT